MMNALTARHVAVFLASILASTSAAVPAPRLQASMVTGSVTSQPIGHYEFCRRNARECNQRFASSPAPRLTAGGWAMLKKVNTSVNGRIAAMTDKEVYGREAVWASPHGAGDCEDYAILKPRELAARGVSPADPIGRTGSGEKVGA